MAKLLATTIERQGGRSEDCNMQPLWSGDERERASQHWEQERTTQIPPINTDKRGFGE